ncbi:MAG: hypothetical protein ABI882_14385 [Acidobacteriota bacterium]
MVFRFVFCFLAAALSIVSVDAQQAVQLTADDAAIMKAALDGAVLPELVRLKERDSGTLLMFDRTIAVCQPDDGAVRRSMGCLGDERNSRLATVFKNDLPASARAEILKSFVERNKANVSIPAKAIAGVTLQTPAAIDAQYDKTTGRGAKHALLSMPAISSDGRAVIYADYWCGNMCGYGWFVLLSKSPDGWRVVARELLWVS